MRGGEELSYSEFEESEFQSLWQEPEERSPRLERGLVGLVDGLKREKQELKETNAGLESELDIVVKEIFNTTNLQQLQELTKANFPKEWSECDKSKEKPSNILSNSNINGTLLDFCDAIDLSTCISEDLMCLISDYLKKRGV